MQSFISIHIIIFIGVMHVYVCTDLNYCLGSFAVSLKELISVFLMIYNDCWQ